MPLTPGTRVGVYKVVSSLGAKVRADGTAKARSVLRDYPAVTSSYAGPSGRAMSGP